MIVPLDKLPLEGTCAERFLALAQTIARAKRRNPGDFHALLQEELRWIKGQATGQLLAYEASIRVLLDLARLGWEIREQGYGIELVSEPTRLRHLQPDEVLAEKQKTRGFFAAALQSQLGSIAVRDFARRMEHP